MPVEFFSDEQAAGNSYCYSCYLDTRSLPPSWDSRCYGRPQLTAAASGRQSSRPGLAITSGLAAGWLAIVISLGLVVMVTVRHVVNPLTMTTVTLGAVAGGVSIVARGDRRWLVGAAALLLLTIASALLSIMGFLYLPPLMLVLVAGGARNADDGQLE